MRTQICKTICIIALALPLLTATQYDGHAQEYNNTPVTVSKEKVRVGGKVCYSHIVLEKQTLYSISKAYNVSIEDIYQYNPSLRETGLKKNSIIIIPSNDTPKTAAKVEQREATKTGIKVVSKEEPKVETKNEPKVETKNEPKVETKKKEEGRQIIHTRKWYEDLDMIAEQYGVSVEDIMKANKLSGRKLAKRQKLVIPTGTLAPETEETLTETAETPAGQEATSTSDSESVQPAETEGIEEHYLFPKNEVHATVLLPMKNAGGRLSRNNMDFYCGLMLAVYDLAQEGVNTDINIYDITDQSTPVTKEDIEGSDLVIGPISTVDLTRLFQTSQDVSPVISPLDPRAENLVATYSDMIQAPTPHKAQYQDLVNWIKEDLKEEDKVFMFSERISRINDAVTAMKEVMDSSGIEYIPFTYSILEGRDVVEPLKEMMTTEGSNRIYIASESEAFVNDVVRNLNLMLIENFEVVLYAPSKIRSFETIEVAHFHKTSMHVSLTYYINYEDPAVKDFLLKYRGLYNTEPTQFAFQGYDIGRYFINLCHRYGDKWLQMLGNSEQEMLQSTFKCVKQGTGGYINNGVRRIVYDSNWTVRQVK